MVAEILKEDRLGKPIEIRVLAHSKSRDDTYKALRKTKDKYTYHFCTGEIPKKGYGGSYRDGFLGRLISAQEIRHLS